MLIFNHKSKNGRDRGFSAGFNGAFVVGAANAIAEYMHANSHKERKKIRRPFPVAKGRGKGRKSNLPLWIRLIATVAACAPFTAAIIKTLISARKGEYSAMSDSDLTDEETDIEIVYSEPVSSYEEVLERVDNSEEKIQDAMQ